MDGTSGSCADSKVASPRAMRSPRELRAVEVDELAAEGLPGRAVDDVKHAVDGVLDLDGGHTLHARLGLESARGHVGRDTVARVDGEDSWMER